MFSQGRIRLRQIDVNYRNQSGFRPNFLYGVIFCAKNAAKYTGATIEDGNGTVYTKLHIDIKPRKSPRVAKKDRNSLGGSAMS